MIACTWKTNTFELFVKHHTMPNVDIPQEILLLNDVPVNEEGEDGGEESDTSSTNDDSDSDFGDSSAED